MSPAQDIVEWINAGQSRSSARTKEESTSSRSRKSQSPNGVRNQELAGVIQCSVVLVKMTREQCSFIEVRARQTYRGWDGCGTFDKKVQLGPLSPSGIGFTTEDVGIGVSPGPESKKAVLAFTNLANISAQICHLINQFGLFRFGIGDTVQEPGAGVISMVFLVKGRCSDNILSSATSDETFVEDFRTLPCNTSALASV
ncbi:hypothetical protein Tco_1459574 [Tanacetum coccineum]